MAIDTKKERYLGRGRKLHDGDLKVTGRTRYPADLTLPGMVHLRPVLSPYAHARIRAIDASRARELPGVVAVLTETDLPSAGRPITSRNSAVLARDRVLWAGQPVAVVAAESEAVAEDAAGLVEVDYEPLPVVADLTQATAEGAPVVWPEGLPSDDDAPTVQHAAVDEGGSEDAHAISNVYSEKHYERGDVGAGFGAADVVLERVYTTEAVHQGYLEPHAAVAEPDPMGEGVTVHTSTQGQYSVRDEVARAVGLPKRQVRVVPLAIGGGFGAKYGILEPLVAAAALAVGRPARLVMTRSEDFVATTPAPAIRIELKLGATRDGRLTALEARILIDNGVFEFPFGGLVALLLTGSYRIPNLRVTGLEVITNRPHAGAYRAPGAPQASFAIESTMDDLARELGLDPIELRLRNASETGDPMINGKPWPSLGFRACLERLRGHPALGEPTGPNEGIGVAAGGWPTAMGPAAAVCRVERDGTVRLHVGSLDVSGVHSSMVLVAAEELGVDPDRIEILQGDTDSGPFGPGSGGSQVTYSLAGAVAKAARGARRQLLEIAAEHLEARAEDLEVEDGEVFVSGSPTVRVSFAELADRAERKAGGHGPILAQGRAAMPENAPGFVVHLARVRVDPDTGTVTPLKYVAVQDVGKALNPTLVHGQIHGGIVQGIGWALHEALRFDDAGNPMSGSFLEYDLPKAHDVPEIESILVENPSPHGPYGARGIGEPPVTAGAAALANAIRDAVGVRMTELPMTPRKVWRAIRERQG